MTELPLQGRVAVITGANQGLGLAIAHAYVKAGASVVLAARDAGLLEKARAEVQALAPAGLRVLAVSTDVSADAAVEQLAQAALQAFPQIHILVNNAGVYGPLGPIEDVNWSDWVKALDINLLGSIRMCRALLPHFKKHRYGKIVQLSGGGATNPLPNITAYAASKAAVVRFAESLALEVRDFGIDVNSIAPGALNTRLLDEVLAAGPDKVGADFYQRSLKQKDQGGAPLDKGAALAVYLGSAASDGLTGRLLSALWDPWADLQKHRADVQKSDVYTLRRIVPKDRGFTWGDPV